MDRAAHLLHHNCCQGTSVQKVLLKTLASLPMERHSLPKNGLSSPAKDYSSSLSPRKGKQICISQIISVDSPCYTIPPWCSPAFKIPLSLLMSRQSYIITTDFKLLHNHGNSEREYERGSGVQQT